MDILLKGKNKKAIASASLKVASASTNVETPENTETVVSEAVKGAKAEGAVIPNTNSSTSSDDLFTRFDKSFTINDNLVTTRKNRNGKV